MVMDADVADVESTAPGRPGAKVDRVLHDRDTVELGGAKLTARLTPGHTPGCTTWTMQVADGGRTLNAVIVGSPNVNAGYVLVGNNRNYPQIAGDYVKTFALLKSLPVDLFLGAHGAYFNLKDKPNRQLQLWRKDGILDLQRGRILLQNLNQLTSVAARNE